MTRERTAAAGPEPPPDPSKATTSGTSAVVLRMRRGWLAGELASVAAGLAGALVFRDHRELAPVCAAVAVTGVMAAVRSARSGIEVRGGWLTLRGPSMGSRSPDSRPLDLRQLAMVTVPAGLGQSRAGGQDMVLRDRRGTEIVLPLTGTLPGQRRRLMATLEPYVMADGVTRAGPVHAALSGGPRWPRPRAHFTVPPEPGKDR